MQLKRRRLKRAPGTTGAEGYEDDHWMIVDGANIIVQLMEPGERARLEKRLAKPKRMAFSESVTAAIAGTRKALALEELWGSVNFKV